MLDGTFYRFDGTALVACQDLVNEVRLAAADSFLVEDGRVRNLAAHYQRFGAWVRGSSESAAGQLESFFAAVTQIMPREGRWFPRIELHLGLQGDAEPNNDALYLRLRTAPEQLEGITLWTMDTPDPRAQPTVKGPDLSLCMQLRRKAQLHSADEAAIVDSDGRLVEGALSAIVWWRGDVLCAPDHQTRWLESVTRNEVFELAKSLGYQTRVENVKPADLVGCEVWALSSLQGIRAVTDWVNLGSPVGAPARAEKFQKRLRMLATAI